METETIAEPEQPVHPALVMRRDRGDRARLRAHGNVERALLARSIEASLLSATIAAQAANFDDLVMALAALHGVAGDRRRDLEEVM
jgi:hypothetical protein